MDENDTGPEHLVILLHAVINPLAAAFVGLESLVKHLQDYADYPELSELPQGLHDIRVLCTRMTNAISTINVTGG